MENLKLFSQGYVKTIILYYIVLYTRALDADDKNIYISGDTDNANKFLNKLDKFYKKLNFKNNGAIYYLD